VLATREDVTRLKRELTAAPPSAPALASRSTTRTPAASRRRRMDIMRAIVAAIRTGGWLLGRRAARGIAFHLTSDVGD
jgi:hypothetical protein